ncbi:flavin reductase family protein [Rhizobium bangladeshense]|uniref:flavin reductase family protein n=1 Tax=Rhizobium bangladeshense TaxID=1138189 RepID=UPI001A985DC1|nr:flavin reductase family protein [Rhizobium bangladeshense]MBX4892959.1 flavin reductase family protein [Rhizobium bangladeshense]MBX4917352.1 flavin reductase family protein [Rhizobium bangladeshense]QSY97470.1 flavin reductase family protein [Rhizobium bangladeshense]
MTYVSLRNLTSRQRYWLITGSVGPRPIGLVTTVNSERQCNAAPFSAFNYLSEEPALLAIGIDLYGDESHRPGERKDTLANIAESGEFVINMVDEPILERAVRCGTDHPSHVSEIDAVGLTPVASTVVAVPRIDEAPIAWECKLFKILQYAESRSIVLGEIVGMHFRDELLDEEAMRVRVDRYAPVGRLGGPTYCRTADRLVVPVPSYDGRGKARV